MMPKDLEDFINTAKRFVGVAPVVQVDIMDGIFVPEKTWPFCQMGSQQLNQMAAQGSGLPFHGQLAFELDLMVDRPFMTFAKWLALSPKRLIFHVESTDNLPGILEGLVPRRPGLEVGIALDTSTPNEMIIPYLEMKTSAGAPLVDFVQCMGIARIGYQGEPFDDRVLGKIKQFRERYPELVVSVDGGVGFDNAASLIAAGANRLVSGSAIMQSDDIPAAIERLKGGSVA